MYKKLSQLILIAGLVLVIGSGIAHSTQGVVSGRDMSFLETPALVQVDFTIINTHYKRAPLLE